MSEFQEQRQSGIGSSDVSAIMGLDRFRSALDVYYSKTRPPDPDYLADNPDVKRGEVLEEHAAESYERSSGYKLLPGGYLQHREAAWAMAHPDRWIERDPEYGILEIKCPRTYNYDRHRAQGPEKSTIIQHQWQLGVAGTSWGTILSFHPDHWWHPLTWDFQFNEELFQDLFSRCEHFWKEHIEKRVPPSFLQQQELQEIDVPELDPDVILVKTEEWEKALRALDAATASKSMAEERYERCRQRVQDLMHGRGYQAITHRELGTVYWRPQKGRSYLDIKLLRKSRPLDPDKLWQWLKVIEERDEDGNPIGSIAEIYGNELWGHCTLDLDAFTKQADPPRPFRFYPKESK